MYHQRVWENFSDDAKAQLDLRSENVEKLKTSKTNLNNWNGNGKTSSLFSVAETFGTGFCQLNEEIFISKMKKPFWEGDDTATVRFLF